jgi:predicted amidohydrolase
MTSTRDIEQNVETCRVLAEQAAADRVRWLIFPENAPFLGADKEKAAIAEELAGPLMANYRDIARLRKMFVTVAGFPETAPTPGHTYNTLVTLNPAGETVAVYRKMHLFDAQVDAQISYRESDSCTPGEELVVSAMDFDGVKLQVGLSVCYDLRFPEMYRELRKRGANILIVPSAFTLQTGRDHWHALLRARAIENQCYVLAPDQVGVHFGQRASFGHSCVYDPWGQLQACAPDRTCLVTADLDLDYLNMVRERMPVEAHRRLDK